MSTEKDNGGPAFPGGFRGDDDTVHPLYEGMSLHDYFAGLAMQGLISNLTYGGELQRIFDAKKRIADDGDPSESSQDYMARLAMSLADSMLKARKK